VNSEPTGTERVKEIGPEFDSIIMNSETIGSENVKEIHTDFSLEFDSSIMSREACTERVKEMHRVQTGI
jgi:hypothetical protein